MSQEKIQQDEIESDDEQRYQNAKEMRSQTMMNKQVSKLSKLMDMFEKQQGSENKLTIKDFKRVWSPYSFITIINPNYSM